MPSGDAQRTWFPEMIVRLRSEWHEGMSIPALIGLRDELDATLHRIRAGLNIQTPIITCRRCGMTGHAAEPRLDPGVGTVRNRVEGSNPRPGKGVGTIPQAAPAGHRRESLGGGPAKLFALKIAGRGFPPQNLRKRVSRSHAPVD
jgi:hypothetical protein